jgi:hypothetical protein
MSHAPLARVLRCVGGGVTDGGEDADGDGGSSHDGRGGADGLIENTDLVSADSVLSSLLRFDELDPWSYAQKRRSLLFGTFMAAVEAPSLTLTLTLT